MGLNSVTNLNEEALLQRLRKGNKEAFQEIYWQYWDKLFMYAYNILKDKEACEDIIQEVFTDLWIRRKKTLITNLPGYLFRAVKFQTIKYIRSSEVSEKYRNRLNQVNLTSQAEEAVHAKELEKIIEDSLRQLPERCREIFYLSRFEHQSNQEIAEKLGLSIQTVKNQISKALKHIKKEVKNSTTILFLVFFQHFL